MDQAMLSSSKTAYEMGFDSLPVIGLETIRVAAEARAAFGEQQSR